MIKIVINWSEPIEIFKPKKYNTDEKFIHHFQKFISEIDSPLLEKEGFYCVVAGSLTPEEKLSTVLIEESFGKSIKEKICRKKGHMREYRCIYKNYGDENIFIKVGIVESLNVGHSEEVYRKIKCKLIADNSPSCNEPCSVSDTLDIEIINTGNYNPLKK
ncbi:hypothetical protein SAMN06265182_1322 [Persephonella hydrogeniphila]|uniref:Uncharacterized protein n=1 Tax=Persephonella hydrogeniphila TaxID=198703 RepID=A0A285NHP4_9AQUI|nr:hypothetical protein [Persephonella hydrogeniphila]SNZ08507.1 hypothetical protein SAMN06265182_1322 [Persephonella hydrogeniphila]